MLRGWLGQRQHGSPPADFQRGVQAAGRRRGGHEPRTGIYLSTIKAFRPGMWWMI